MIRTIISFTIILLYAYTTTAQQVRIIVQPNIVDPEPVFLQDTVWIGFHPDASLGIDEFIGEEDISNHPPFGNLDVRVIQRDTTNVVCAYIEQPNIASNFPENNFDTKINYHSIDDTTLANRVFQIQISTLASSTFFFIEGSEALGKIVDEIYVSSDSCTLLPSLFEPSDTLSTGFGISTGNAKYMTVIFKEELFTSIAEVETIEKLQTVFPNPFSHELIIEDKDLNESSISIINSIGQTMPIEGIKGHQKFSIPTHSWPSGSYFIFLQNKEGRLMKSGKVIKLF